MERLNVEVTTFCKNAFALSHLQLCPILSYPFRTGVVKHGHKLVGAAFFKPAVVSGNGDLRMCREFRD